jgi:hypothetical protein
MMTIGMSIPRKGLPKAPTATTMMATKVTTIEVATTAVTMVEIMATTTRSWGSHWLMTCRQPLRRGGRLRVGKLHR